MKKFQWSVLGIGALWIAVGNNGVAQDALQATRNRQEYIRSRARSRETAPLPAHLGPVQFALAGGLRMAYDSNVFLEENNTRDDFYISPNLSLDAHWPIDPLSGVNFTTRVGYQKYVQYDQKDQFRIPTSNLSWYRTWRNFRVGVHDHFRLIEDPAEDTAAANTAKFGGFENTAGLALTTFNDSMNATAGYDHFEYIATAGAAERRARSAEYLFARAGYIFQPWIQAGPEFSAGFTDYDRNFLSDSDNYSIGAYAEIQVTEKLRVDPHAGWTYYDFGPSLVQPVASTHDSFFGDVSVIHDYNRYFSQSLSGGYRNQLGSEANLEETLFAAYALRFRLNPRINMGLGAGVTQSSESQSRQTDDFQTYRIGPSFQFRLTSHLSTGLAYQYYQRKSDANIRNYSRSIVSLNLTGNF